VNEITGDYEAMAHDDLPLEMRECIRVSRAVERIPRVGAVLDMSTPEAQAAMEAYTTHRAECPTASKPTRTARSWTLNRGGKRGTKSPQRSLKPKRQSYG